jgi:hypothetical protein
MSEFGDSIMMLFYCYSGNSFLQFWYKGHEWNVKSTAEVSSSENILYLGVGRQGPVVCSAWLQ